MIFHNLADAPIVLPLADGHTALAVLRDGRLVYLRAATSCSGVPVTNAYHAREALTRHPSWWIHKAIMASRRHSSRRRAKHPMHYEPGVALSIGCLHVAGSDLAKLEGLLRVMPFYDRPGVRSRASLIEEPHRIFDPVPNLIRAHQSYAVTSTGRFLVLRGTDVPRNMSVDDIAARRSFGDVELQPGNIVRDIVLRRASLAYAPDAYLFVQERLVASTVRSAIEHYVRENFTITAESRRCAT